MQRSTLAIICGGIKQVFQSCFIAVVVVICFFKSELVSRVFSIQILVRVQLWKDSYQFVECVHCQEKERKDYCWRAQPWFTFNSGEGRIEPWTSHPLSPHPYHYPHTFDIEIHAILINNTLKSIQV